MISLKDICYLFVLTALFFSSCSISRKSKFNFTTPDYSSSYFWAALPFKKDSADLVVPNSGLKDKQSTAKADVFYIHPTNYTHGRKWNADLNDPALRNKTDREACKLQATVFNGSCKVYLPRYRAAKVRSYFASDKKKKEVWDIAYNDIREAFLYYLKNYNNGRPLIIAAHSQGTDHGIRLCKEFFDKDTILNKKLIAAYLIGGLVFETTFLKLKPCADSTQTDCYVTWNSVRYGEFLFLGKPVNNVVCVNPLTWTLTKEQAPDSLNLGGLPFSFKRIDPRVADARISANGLLWVHRPDKNKIDYPRINTRSYHILEYNLFYMNIRKNVQQRINAYFLK